MLFRIPGCKSSFPQVVARRFSRTPKYQYAGVLPFKRMFKVRINSLTSPSLPIQTSVPQYTALGPFLYIYWLFYYVNNFNCCTSHTNPRIQSSTLPQQNWKEWPRKLRLKINKRKFHIHICAILNLYGILK